MYCPFCGAFDTKVIDSRLVAEGQQVRRRRECVECAERFTTYESAELVMPRVIKQDGKREPFLEEKLRGGLVKALQKRPVATEEIETAVSRIKHDIRSMGEREVSSIQIGQQVMSVLRELDPVAYIRFASVYRSFNDIGEFLKEVEELQCVANTWIPN